MRRVLTLVAAIAMISAMSNDAQAARRVRVAQPRARIFQRTTVNRPGIFSRLMELERAKNAWLFGR